MAKFFRSITPEYPELKVSFDPGSNETKGNIQQIFNSIEPTKYSAVHVYSHGYHNSGGRIDRLLQPIREEYGGQIKHGIDFINIEAICPEFKRPGSPVEMAQVLVLNVGNLLQTWTGLPFEDGLYELMNNFRTKSRS